MAQTNAERQRRWRQRHQTARDDGEVHQAMATAEEALRATLAIRDEASLAKAKRLATRALLGTATGPGR